MEHFEEVLDDCLQQMADGVPLGACLKQYPAEAAELEPLLRAAAGLEHGRRLRPSPRYTRTARAALVRKINASARPQVARPETSSRPFWRLVLVVSSLVIALMISGTAYAQRTVPGDSLYGWKITSEQALRVVSQDPIGVDLLVAERRVSEYLQVAADPDRGRRALDGYGEVLVRLKFETDDLSRGRIVPILNRHAVSLKDSGVTIPELDDYLVLENEKGNSKSPGGKKNDQPPFPKTVPTVIVPPPQ